MARYKSIPVNKSSLWVCDEYYESCGIDNITVFEDEDPVHTGLLDVHGNPIFRLKDPIGFMRS